MRNVGLISLLCFITSFSFSQKDPFSIELEPLTIADLPGIQAYTFGQDNGRWLVLGGRIDGLHRRQPFATFLPEGRNVEAWVVDPEQHQIWKSTLTSLPTPLQDQLSSTNMEFHQEGSTLYIAGGYGYSATVDSKITYAMLTAVDVPGIINAIQHQESLAPYVRFITDTRLAVTGGHLGKIEDTWYLLGGQKFDGNYNPMNHPTFVQEYTNAIRKFQLEDDGQKMEITGYEVWSDTALFHRRDYNAGPEIRDDGHEGIMSFAGPFRVDADIPYLNVVSVGKEQYHEVPGFAQYYNQYHCAHLALYDANTTEMHTVFLGGIAQYYPGAEGLISDSDVPFVRTIARVTRDAGGRYTEYLLPTPMPGLIGASAEFIPNTTLPTYANGVIKLNALPKGRTLAGYMYGGIESSGENIFWINEGEASKALEVLYKVFIVTGEQGTTHMLNAESQNNLQLQVLPNNTTETFAFRFHLTTPEAVSLQITTLNGKVIVEKDLTAQTHAGENYVKVPVPSYKIGNSYNIMLTAGDATARQNVIVKP